MMVGRLRRVVFRERLHRTAHVPSRRVHSVRELTLRHGLLLLLLLRRIVVVMRTDLLLTVIHQVEVKLVVMKRGCWMGWRRCLMMVLERYPERYSPRGS